MTHPQSRGRRWRTAVRAYQLAVLATLTVMALAGLVMRLPGASVALAVAAGLAALEVAFLRSARRPRR